MKFNIRKISDYGIFIIEGLLSILYFGREEILLGTMWASMFIFKFIEMRDKDEGDNE